MDQQFSFAFVPSCIGAIESAMSILLGAAQVRPFSSLFHPFDVTFYLSSSSWLPKIQCCVGAELHCGHRVCHVYPAWGCTGSSFLLFLSSIRCDFLFVK